MPFSRLFIPAFSFVSFLSLAVAQPAEMIVPPGIPLSSCAVTPLPPIVDGDALEFEYGPGTAGAIDTGGLSPAMSHALLKFQQMVTLVGGKFELKSAYRPPSYQTHLQEVWYKWMELRNNRETGCQSLRAQVSDEFSRHHLIESQKPVTSSDHTRGLAFDAVVVLPKAARLKRVRVSLDRLALLSGIRRPDIVRDPVHFKLFEARKSRRT